MTIIPALTIIYDSIWLKTVRCVFEVMQLKIKKNYIRNRMISNRVIQRFPIKINCLQLMALNNKSVNKNSCAPGVQAAGLAPHQGLAKTRANVSVKIKLNDKNQVKFR